MFTPAIYENSTTIWATISHQEQLRNAGFSLGPAADLGLRSFRLEKQRRYMDIRGEEPMWYLNPLVFFGFGRGFFLLIFCVCPC